MIEKIKLTSRKAQYQESTREHHLVQLKNNSPPKDFSMIAPRKKKMKKKGYKLKEENKRNIIKHQQLC